MDIPLVPLKKGVKMPIVGLGTWLLSGDDCTRVVESALKAGYRHIDTAHAYGNHKSIGKAIKGFEREKLFITSKILLEQVDPANVAESVQNACDLALKELGCGYLDLYLIHHPNRSMPMNSVLKEMQALMKQGKVRSIGVSNFTLRHLQDVLEEKIPIVANQVEFHPYLNQKKLWGFCKRNKIQLISYRSLGKGALIKEEVFKKIGKKYEKTSAQIILRWLVQKGIPVIPKASSTEHLIQNIDLFDFKLTLEEMRQLDNLNQDKRYCAPEWIDFDY